MRRRLIAFTLIATLLGAAPSAAQVDPTADEGDIVSDVVIAEADGFKPLLLLDLMGSAEREFVDKTFMRPIADSIDRGAHYGFSFALVDLTGDGVDDLVLAPRMVRLRPPEGFDQLGAATFVYVSDGDRWKLAIEGGAMVVATRETESGAKDVALVEQVGYVSYFWDGSAFIRR